MSINLSKQNLKKLLLLGIVVVLIFISVNAFIKQRQRIEELEQTLAPVGNKLAFQYSSYPSDYAFDAIEEEPTTDNFTLLFHVLINQQKKIESLIQLNKSKIDEATWKKYKNKPSTQAIMYVNNLSNHVNDINQSDWERLHELEKQWHHFEDRTDNLIYSGSGTVTNPSWLASSYIELLNNLDNIEGIEH